MNAVIVWPITSSTAGTPVILCPRCAGEQMRHVASEITRSAVSLRFTCCECERQAAMQFELGRLQTRATWEWLR